MTQPADHRRAWRCPACEQAIHYIQGQDPVKIHAPHCEALDKTAGPAAHAAKLAAESAAREQ